MNKLPLFQSGGFFPESNGVLKRCIDVIFFSRRGFGHDRSFFSRYKMVNRVANSRVMGSAGAMG
jgi:hypothetical protein